MISPIRAFRLRGWALCALACVSLSACLDVANDLQNDGGSGGDGACSQCHGAEGNSAAHAAHVSGDGTYGKAFACAECHPVPPAPTNDGTHVDTVIDVIFPEGGLARAAGATPMWDGVGCSGVYCHGITVGGGTDTAPDWTDEGIACGQCHSIPPPSPHPNEDLDSCGECHEGAISGGWPNPETHIDGVVEGGGDDDATGAQP